MGFATVPLFRRRRGPANEVSNYRPIWEGRVDTAGWFTAVVQAQALNGTDPGSGWVRARNVTTGAITTDVEIATADGRGEELKLPELAVAAGDLIEIQARPGTAAGQIYVEHAAGTVSTAALTTTPPAAVPAVFGAITIDPTTPTLGASFELDVAILSGSTDLGGVMSLEVEWRTPDGSNPMGGTAAGGGWYRGLGRTTATTPATITWDDAELVADVAGTHSFRFTATNSTGVTVSETVSFTVVGTGVAVRGFSTPTGLATSHSIPSTSLTADGTAVSGSNPSVLQPGDKVLLVISGPGPSAAGSLTYSHPGSTIDGGDFAGSTHNPRGRIALVDYSAPTTWTVTASSSVRVVAIALAGAVYAKAGTPIYGLSPQNPAGVANVDDSLGLFVQLTNFDGGVGTTVTAAPASHTTVVNSGAGTRQIYVARQTTASAGTYDPGAATTGPGSEESTAVAVTVAPTLPAGGGGGGGSSSTDAPDIPTFNTGTAVALTSGMNIAAVVATYPEGTHFSLAAGTYNNCSDVRPKTGMHFKGAGVSTILEGSGKGYAFRSGTVGTSDNVVIGNMLIRNYGQGTSRQEYGAIQGMPTDTVGGQYAYARSNNWFIYGCTLATNASNGVALSDNCTVYDCTIYGHTVTGINGDRNSGGHLIHSCLIEANALNPATGSSSNGANIKLTWTAAGPGRTTVVPGTWQRPTAPTVIANCTSNATRSGISGTCRIGIWLDLDVRDVLIDGCTLTGHTTSGIFFEGSNYGRVQNCDLTNCDGFGTGTGQNFVNGAISCGESTNIVFDSNTITDSTNAMVNRMSNRSSDWLSASSGENYAMSPRNWLSQSTTIPTNSPAGLSNVWTGNNTFSNNVLVNCSRVIINEGTNSGGQTTIGSTNLSSIHFVDNDYSGSPSIQFYHVSNTPISLTAWRALAYDRDQP